MDSHWIYTDKKSGRYRVVLPKKVASALGVSRWYGRYSDASDALEDRDELQKQWDEAQALGTSPVPKEEVNTSPEEFCSLDEPMDEIETPVCRVLTSAGDITSAEELMEHFQVDTDLWEVERKVINKWPTTMKSKTGDPISVNNFQIKLFLRHKLGGIDLDEMARLIHERVPPCEPLAPFEIPEDPHALEINIPDLHYGQLSWAPESGAHYDSAIAAERFMSAIQRLLGLAKGFNLEKIYFPIGHDFFNTDTINDTTTAGTPQHNDGRWQKMYQEGVKLLIEAVDFLRQHAPVEVILVQGNHDYERSYCGALHLDAHFRNDTNVTVNWQPIERKYVIYGNTMVCHTHGKGPKKKDWLGIVASEVPELWGKSKFREVHLGHFHHLEVEEQHGLVVRYLGSLAATDNWHYHKGFVGARKSAHAYIYHPVEGPVVNTTYHVIK